MGKQKIDKCNEIVSGHRSTPRPHSHFEAEWKINDSLSTPPPPSFSLPLSLCFSLFASPSLYLCVILPQLAVVPAVVQGVDLFLFCQKSSPGAK